MFEILKGMYLTGKLTEPGLDNAVRRGWLTPAEKADILSAS